MQNKATASVKISINLPRLTYLTASAIANRNGEPLASFLKRLVIVGVEDAASAGFKASNFINHAIKNNQLDPDLKAEILDYLETSSKVISGDENDSSEVE